MRKSSSQPISRQSRVGAGAAGVGGGTLLAAVASSMKDSNPMKQWLLLSAPSLSVFLNIIWLWLSVKISNYIYDRDFQYRTTRLQKTLEERISNPNTTEEHRKLLQKDLEKIDKIVVARSMKLIESIKIVTESDFETR